MLHLVQSFQSSLIWNSSLVFCYLRLRFLKHIRQKKSEEIASLEKELKALLGTKVKLPNAADKGKIEISFTSREERDRLIGLLKTLGV